MTIFCTTPMTPFCKTLDNPSRLTVQSGYAMALATATLSRHAEYASPQARRDDALRCWQINEFPLDSNSNLKRSSALASMSDHRHVLCQRV